MATESDLRDLLRGPGPDGPGSVDVDAVIARARRRRRPRVVAAQLLGSAALVAGVSTAALVGIPAAQEASLMTAAGGTAEQDAAAPEADYGGRWAMDACGEPPVAGDSTGWTLLADSVETPGAGRLEAHVALRNDSPEVVSGEATIWALTIVRAGVVVAHADPVGGASHVLELAPGATASWDVEATLATCDASAPLPAGAYDVRAVVQVASSPDAPLRVVYGIPASAQIG